MSKIDCSIPKISLVKLNLSTVVVEPHNLGECRVKALNAAALIDKRTNINFINTDNIDKILLPIQIKSKI